MTQKAPHDYFQGLIGLLTETVVSQPNEKATSLDAGIDAVVDMISGLVGSSNKAIVIGNGGSSAIANHLQTDLSYSIKVRALVFDGAPLLTCLSNDLGYPAAYERMVNLWAEPGDLLIAISSSGKSENILRAVNAARAKGCRTVTMSAFAPDNPLRRLGDISFYVPAPTFGEAELAHSLLSHYITDRALSLYGNEAAQ
jgi:D-sedoheptulose 7-phosphate isomerase